MNQAHLNLAVSVEKNWGLIQLWPDFIDDCPNHDVAAFYSDDKMSHIFV